MSNASRSIAAQKREENIVEYVLYVWQMEDLLRGAGFESEKLRDFLAPGMESNALELEMRWLAELGNRMRQQDVMQKGHIREVEEALAELVYLHRTLLGVIKDEAYARQYKLCEPGILDLMERSMGSARNEVEACLTGVYGLLMLRLQKQSVSEATQQTLQSISKLLAMLASHYRQMRYGESQASLN
jgi:hypothetical protein